MSLLTTSIILLEIALSPTHAFSGSQINPPFELDAFERLGKKFGHADKHILKADYVEHMYNVEHGTLSLQVDDMWRQSMSYLHGKTLKIKKWQDNEERVDPYERINKNWNFFWNHLTHERTKDGKPIYWSKGS